MFQQISSKSTIAETSGFLVDTPPSLSTEPYYPFPVCTVPGAPSQVVRTPNPNPDPQFRILNSIFPKPVSFIDSKPIETQNNTSKYHLADILHENIGSMIESGKLSPQQYKTVKCIINCRTEAYGYHADVCDECGFIEISYNSCRNRHCPRCQGIAKRQWVGNRIDELLPVSYHHAVFTVPSYISMLSLYNQKLIYDLLFFAASLTLLAFGNDPKHLGAKIGFYGILHTWSQTLLPHIHIHFIVTAGGLTDDHKWKEPKYAKKFLFPVRALSKVFRGKFIEGLKKLYYNNQLTIPDSMEEINTAEGFEKKLNALSSRPWRVYSKPPFSGPEEVVRYIGRYTHRIAISESRILCVKDGQVTFSYKDSKEKDPEKKYKEMILPTEEFIRRFLYHILPNRYHRIRYYGFLANGKKKENIDIIRDQLPKTQICENPKDEEGKLCPECEKGKMTTFLIINGRGQMNKCQLDLLPSNLEYEDTS